MAELFTFEDAVDHLVDVFALKRNDGRHIALVKRAVLEGYRFMGSAADWSYLYTRHTFATNAPYSTGTIAYTEASRTVTLTGGTWPSNAEDFQIVFSAAPFTNVPYRIESRESDTTLTLHANMTPGQDIAAGTSYTLPRACYDLPSDFRQIGYLLDTVNQHQLQFVDPDVNEELNIFYYDSTDTPWQYTILPHVRNPSELGLWLTPPPASIRVYQFLYNRQPRSLRYERETDGTIAVTAGSPTVTGTGTAFAAGMVGSVLRIGTSTKAPSAAIGSPSADTIPYVEEHRIKDVTDATTLTLHDNVSASATAAKYTISDPIDMEPGAMLTAFLRKIEADYTRLSRSKPTERAERDKAFLFALTIAKESDTRTVTSMSRAYYDPFRRANIDRTEG